MSFKPGTSFHTWKIIHHCGGGAFGEVYYCSDISGQHVAVKVIPKNRLGNYWERELTGVSSYREITGKTDGLLRIFHVSEDSESLFYSMEAADNCGDDNEYRPDTLSRRLEHGSLPVDEQGRVINDIFAAVKKLHEFGFAHCDIKPENILFVKGKPKLGDIGLVSSFTATMSHLVGTLEFLPPELRLRETVDDIPDKSSRQKSDLYALGKVIYCIVTGMSAENFPSIPQGFKPALRSKFLLRFAFRLCDRQIKGRIADIGAAERELSEIERKTLYGETIVDKVKYCCGCFSRYVRGWFSWFWRGGLRYWPISILIIFLAAAGIWQILPEPEFDIADIKTQDFVDNNIGVAMTMPAQWNIIDDAFKEKLLNMDSDGAPQEVQKFIEVTKEMTSDNQTAIIHCGYHNYWNDNITIQAMPPLAELWDCSDSELRSYLSSSWESELGVTPEIYEIKRMEKAGSRCIYIDMGYYLGEIPVRVNNYYIDRGNKTLLISLTARKDAFKDLKPQFEAVLATLKFI